MGPRIVFESVLIAFSIMLALAMHAWVSGLETQARVREARAFFVEEIRANRELLLSDGYLPHHVRLRDALVSLDGVERVTMETVSPALAQFRGGVHSRLCLTWCGAVFPPVT